MPETEARGKKRTYISMSSSYSSGVNDEEEDLSEEEPPSESESDEYDDDDYDEEEETGISTSSDGDREEEDGVSDWSDEKENELNDQEDEGSSDDRDDDDESLCNNVIRLLREKSDLQELNLRECKSYLRQHGLRITGTKAECVQRIMEHWRIKEGNAEALYPRSSFAINCTGDVCKGDVVLFTQKVYKKFDKVTKRGSLLGNRTIAGRVVKESYGAAKQQHTFTIEVLWSNGIKPLPPLFPLLVKGRNLYKLKTFRQYWKNETERLEVLAEKHKRGAAARFVRSMRKTKKTCLTNGGRKAEARKEKRRGDPCGKAPAGHVRPPNHCQDPPVHIAYLKKISKPALKPSKQHQNLTLLHNSGGSAKSYPRSAQMQFHHRHHWRAPLCLPPYEVCSTSSATRFPPFRPYMDSSVMPVVSQSHRLTHVSYPPRAYSYPSRVLEPRNFNGIYELSNPFSYGKETYGQRRGF